MKKNKKRQGFPGILVRIAILASLISALFACDPFPRVNPADPGGTAYQGFSTVGSISEVLPIAPTTDLAYPPTLTSVKLALGTAYTFQISSVSGFTSDVYEIEQASNVLTAAAWTPSLGAGTYYFRVKVKTASEEGAWTASTAFNLIDVIVATPTFSVPAGTYDEAKTITLATTTIGASIRYTVDGSTPSSTNGTLYTAAITVSASKTVKAIGYKSHFTDSSVASASYVFEPAAPTFSIPGATYSTRQTLTLSTTTTGAFIRYTTNGSTPTATAGTVYSGSITLASSQTIKAVSYKEGWSTSDVVSATYTINLPQGVWMDGYAISESIGHSDSQASAGETMNLDMKIRNNTTSQVYNLSATLSSDSSYISFTDNTQSYGYLYAGYYCNGSSGSYGGYSSSSSLTLNPSGGYFRFAIASNTPAGTVIPISISFSGGSSYYSSNTLSWTDSFSITVVATDYRVATPVYSVPAGTYDTTQTITISTTTTGASIRYTTNGTTPSATNGTVYSSPIALSATATLKAFSYKSDWIDSAIASATYIINTIAPTFSVVAGRYSAIQYLTLTSDTPNASIKYTTDGSTPSSTNGTLYSTTITVGTDCTIKAIAYKTGQPDSSVSSAAYTFYVADPTFSVAGGAYTIPKSLTLSSATPGATIRYTNDGSTPTSTSGQIFSGAISLTSDQTIKAFAYYSTWPSSSVVSATYSFRTADPVFSVAAGTYTASQSLTLSTATTGATIRYTTDGTAPSKTFGTLYSGGTLSISTNQTVKAIAYYSTWPDSAVVSAAYSFKAPDPTFSPGADTYSVTQSVYLSAGSGASIRYTTDGTSPTSISGTLYSSYITVTQNTTIKAIAYKAGWADSSVVSAVYGIRAATPTFSPGAGPYTEAQTVTISTATSGASIRYTIDGTTPSSTNGTVYTGAFGIPSNLTLKACAYSSNMADSGVASAAYSFRVATPVISLASNTYTSAQTITISTTTSGASIRYTTDGSTPTSTTGTVYTGALSPATMTLRAYAYKSNWTDSYEATSKTYTFQPAAPTFSPAAGTYSSAQSVTISSTTRGAPIPYFRSPPTLP
ncbi:MAG: chitobiase/beta-hexosaminidase C-terminal domain-containing protein [Spirochaetes bacterium]|nr:chitobiase/beta-hexosaminidase C-terminal domain-containing protein [Spirochaetota bacterium]